jgi:hypothetical protein
MMAMVSDLGMRERMAIMKELMEELMEELRSRFVYKGIHISQIYFS